MDKIYFKVSGQSLMKTGGLSTYASDTVEYIQAEFTLSDEWKEYDSVRAIWQNGDIVAPPSVLDSEGKCLVPFEVLAERGRVTVNLVGSSANGIILAKRITSYIVTAFMVTVKVNIDGSDPQTITPSQFEQFVEAVKDNADRAEAGAGEAKDEADRAESEAESALASAQAAESSATRASNYVADARGYAKSASDSADASADSATASANSASASAGSASDSADSASASATSAREAEEAKQTILTMRAVARSLPEGSQATASYENGVLTLGIPKGDKGDTGNGIDHVVLNEDYTLTVYFTDGTSVTTESIRGEKGETGAVPDFAIGEVTTLDPDEEATAEITGTAEEPILNLGIPQGKTGEVSYEDLSSLLPLDTASGDIISIPDGQSVIPVKSLEVQLDPKQDLHGYDKPWSGGSGANKWDEEWEVGIISWAGFNSDDGSTRIRSKNFNPCVAGNEYRVVTSGNLQFFYYDSNKEFVSYEPSSKSNGSTITIPTGASYFRFYTYQTSYGTTYKNDIAINYPSSVTTYSPYSNICPISGRTEVVTTVSPTTDAEDGTSYTTTLGRTVYGGTLDVVSGVLTANWGIITDFSGLYYSQTSKWTLSMPNADLDRIRAETISSHYSRYAGGWAYIPNGRFQAYAGVLGIADSDFQTAAEMRQHLIDDNVQFVYPLATPQTYQLDPQTISLLHGNNNVWSDGSVELTYNADVQLWVEKKLS